MAGAAMIPLSAIIFDAGTQIRADICEETVAEYALAMTAGDRFPPVVLFHDGNQYYMADGFHRGIAARRILQRDIAAVVYPGTQQDALWYALGANRANGRRLNLADKKHAILLALKAWGGEGGKSVREISEQIGCALSYVQQIEKQVTCSGHLEPRARVTGKDGKSYPATKAKPKSTDHSKAAVVQRQQDVRDMAERGYTTRQIASTLGISEKSCAVIAKKAGITVHADRVVGKTKRHDSTRIVESIVMGAENFVEGENLIEFADLDPKRFAGWLASLETARDRLGEFIRRLRKEKQKHVEAA